MDAVSWPLPAWSNTCENHHNLLGQLVFVLENKAALVVIAVQHPMHPMFRADDALDKLTISPGP